MAKSRYNFRKILYLRFLAEFWIRLLYSSISRNAKLLLASINADVSKKNQLCYLGLIVYKKWMGGDIFLPNLKLLLLSFRFKVGSATLSTKDQYTSGRFIVRFPLFIVSTHFHTAVTELLQFGELQRMLIYMLFQLS